jgi:hypothetical protein
MRKLISVFAYYSFFQKNIVQVSKNFHIASILFLNELKFLFMFKASYWHDPMDDEINYSNYNLFLADINQVKVIENFLS